MTRNQPCLRFGKLAVQMGFITPEQLAAALAMQELETPPQRRMIGLILFDEGWLTTVQIEQVLTGIFLQPQRPAQRTVVDAPG